MADERFFAALDAMKEQVDDLLRQAAEKKRFANSLAQMAGLEPVYSDVADPASSLGGASTIRADQFTNYNAPSAAARAFLELRGKDRGSVGIDVIYDALLKGGYGFTATNAEDAKNGLAIALGKDRLVRRLPNGTYGLLTWYPNARREPKDSKRTATSADGSTAAPVDSSASGDDEGDDEEDGDDEASEQQNA